ncbi:hypothetical protein BDZ91DRAFT_799942 [Kalaharituber pfeilii]|nr:hypothetical protein BDZ91DRAFT_799942 [Kalaharituber pfeilii]
MPMDVHDTFAAWLAPRLFIFFLATFPPSLLYAIYKVSILLTGTKVSESETSTRESSPEVLSTIVPPKALPKESEQAAPPLLVGKSMRRTRPSARSPNESPHQPQTDTSFKTASRELPTYIPKPTGAPLKRVPAPEDFLYHEPRGLSVNAHEMRSHLSAPPGFVTLEDKLRQRHERLLQERGAVPIESSASIDTRLWSTPEPATRSLDPIRDYYQPPSPPLPEASRWPPPPKPRLDRSIPSPKECSIAIFNYQCQYAPRPPADYDESKVAPPATDNPNMIPVLIDHSNAQLHQTAPVYVNNVLVKKVKPGTMEYVLAPKGSTVRIGAKKHTQYQRVWNIEAPGIHIVPEDHFPFPKVWSKQVQVLTDFGMDY